MELDLLADDSVRHLGALWVANVLRHLEAFSHANTVLVNRQRGVGYANALANVTQSVLDGLEVLPVLGG